MASDADVVAEGDEKLVVYSARCLASPPEDCALDAKANAPDGPQTPSLTGVVAPIVDTASSLAMAVAQRHNPSPADIL